MNTATYKDAETWNRALLGKTFVSSADKAKNQGQANVETASAFTEADLPKKHRIIKPDELTTTDFVEDRLNYFFFQKEFTSSVSTASIMNLDNQQSTKGQKDIHTPMAYACVYVDGVIWNLKDLPVTVPVKVFSNPVQSSVDPRSRQYVRRPSNGSIMAMTSVPQCLFGRIGQAISIHVIFPRLSPTFTPGGSGELPAYLIRLWQDLVVNPAYKSCLPRSYLESLETTNKAMDSPNSKDSSGIFLPPYEVLRVTRTMRKLVEDDDFLRCRFGEFFFHVAFHNIHRTVTIPLVNLSQPEEVRQWRERALKEYVELFDEGERETMQLDVGLRFIASGSAVIAHGPIHLLWKADPSLQLGGGTWRSPRWKRWWTFPNASSMEVGGARDNVVDFNGSPPDVSYVQTSNMDDTVLHRVSSRLTSNLTWRDMQWSNRRFSSSWEEIMKCIEGGARTSWSTKLQVRMSSKLFYGTTDLGGLLHTGSALCRNVEDYFMAMPSLLVARYKAANMWTVRDGAMRVDAHTAPGRVPMDPERQGFMRVLEEMYRMFLP
ncbi:hypothetical protein BJ684DRAFT_18545 [Piptocephalis cylindrospora]|uniref:Uncharacterized protein n=1 Tax=Piptocephalis cylindrospora TaxID=1907219 RepID=A0A4P9Y9K7_9FUNG|nr:hypothetical protein BJ684DRAFT_18545 [Piptocephalis cylindrospora]|eukprot:RKP15111.1 hypothetical protein BJ684DRAFT_18545 [Piptocephalis cylindrospora]